MFRMMTKPSGWVRTLAGAAAFLAIAAVATPAGATTTSGTGLSLTDLAVVSSSGSSSTVYKVTVTKLLSDTATGVNLYFAPELDPSNKSGYHPMEIAQQSCTANAAVNPTSWHCQFTVDWTTGAAWYNSAQEYEPGVTVHQWYVKNYSGLLEIFAQEVGNSGKGWSTMSDMIPLIDIPPNSLPEVPYTFGLPVILIAGIGGAVVLGRRRRQQH